MFLFVCLFVDGPPAGQLWSQQHLGAFFTGPNTGQTRSQETLHQRSHTVSTYQVSKSSVYVAVISEQKNIQIMCSDIIRFLNSYNIGILIDVNIFAVIWTAVTF